MGLILFIQPSVDACVGSTVHLLQRELLLAWVDTQPVVRNLWVETSLGIKQLSLGHLRPSENTSIYIMIYNSSKIIQ